MDCRLPSYLAIMKQPSEDLFLLITRMSDAEKEYFRKFCLILKEVNHISTISLLHLFNAICELKTYDETKLKRKLAGSITGSSFRIYKAVLKNYLGQGIEAYRNSLRSPANYRYQISHAETLLNKEMDKVALQHLHQLQQTLKTDNSARNTIHLLDALSIENRLMQQTDGNHVAQRTAASKALLEQTLRLQQEQEQQLISDRLALLVSENLLLNTPQQQAEFAQLKSTATSFALKINNPNYYHTVQQGMYVSLLEADFEKHLKYALHFFSGFRQSDAETVINESPLGDYANSLLYLIRAGALAKNDEALCLAMNVKRGEYFTRFQHHSHYGWFVHFALLNYFRLAGNYETVMNILQFFESNCLPANPDTDMLRYRWFATTLALIYYEAGNYKKALHYANRVATTNPHNFCGIYYRDFCCIFRFVCESQFTHQYTTREHDAYIDLVQSTINTFKKEHGLNPGNKNRSFELCLLDYFLNPLPETRNHCLAELTLLRHTTIARHYNALFDFEQWLRSL